MNELVNIMIYSHIAMSIYIFYLMWNKNELKIWRCLYAVTLMFFIWLKLEIIPYEYGSNFDKLMWTTYNILFSAIFIGLLYNKKMFNLKDYNKYKQLKKTMEAEVNCKECQDIINNIK